MKSSRIRMLALGLGACLLAPCGVARAQPANESREASPVEEAQRHFALGVRLHAEGDYASALAQFWRAYEVKPHFKVLYNIAQCNFELRDYVEARAALRRYLTEGGGAALDPERRARVDADLSDLERRIAHLEIRSDAPGAVVYIDGRNVGTTPLTRPVDVNEGQRAITIELVDQGVRQRSILLAGGERKIVEVSFAHPARRPAGTGAPPEHRSVTTDVSMPRLGAGFWSVSAGALLLAGGASVTGYLTLRAESERRDALNRPGTSAAQLDQDRQKIQRLARTTDALLGGALVCTGIATALFVWNGSEGTHQVALGADRIVVSGSF